MIQVYQFNRKELPDPLERADLLSNFSEKRREKILRCQDPDKRKEIAGAGILLSHILGQYGTKEAELQYGSNGKPESDKICFNLSHSGEMIICAVSELLVGCDIEKQRTGYERMLRRIFTEKEKTMWEHLSEKERDDLFLRIWTIKESYIKMTGEGLKVPLTSLEVEFGEQIKLKRDGETTSCSCWEDEMPGYRMAVCVQGNSDDLVRSTTDKEYQKQLFEEFGL